MSPFKLNLIIYIFILELHFITAIEQQMFRKIKDCSMPSHIQASEVVIEEIQLLSLTEWSTKCSEFSRCGVFMFDKPNAMCYLVDKDYAVCDDNIGVYELVRFFRLG